MAARKIVRRMLLGIRRSQYDQAGAVDIGAGHAIYLVCLQRENWRRRRRYVDEDQIPMILEAYPRVFKCQRTIMHTSWQQQRLTNAQLVAQNPIETSKRVYCRLISD